MREFFDPPQGEINDYAIRPLRTFEIKGIRVGGLICNDMWANPQCTPMPDPHLSQKLSKKPGLKLSSWRLTEGETEDLGREK